MFSISEPNCCGFGAKRYTVQDRYDHDLLIAEGKNKCLRLSPTSITVKNAEETLQVLTISTDTVNITLPIFCSLKFFYYIYIHSPDLGILFNYHLSRQIIKMKISKFRYNIFIDTHFIKGNRPFVFNQFLVEAFKVSKLRFKNCWCSMKQMQVLHCR